MTAEVKYVSGPVIVRETGPLRGEAVMWVKVGASEKLRPVSLTTDQLTHLALQCLLVMKARVGE